MHATRLSLASATFLFGSVLALQAAEPAKPAAKTTDCEFTVGEPIRHANLTIFPIVSRTERNADRFITLDEGLKAGTVEVLEVSAVNGAPNPFQAPAGNEANPPVQQANQQPLPEQLEIQQQQLGNAGGNNVNQVFVVNKSDKPLFLMPGEIIIGGDQDRTIGQEYVIQPTKKPVPIAVFCVEHGRWGGRAELALSGLVDEATAGENRDGSVALAGQNVQQLAQQANAGKFIGSVGNVSKGVRIAVQEGQGQLEVWNKVGEENAKSNVKSGSDNFVGNYAESDAVKRLDPYLKHLQTPVAETERVVGVIVAVNDKMDSAEMLESTPLFRKLWPKLLKSYALDAVNSVPAKSSPKQVAKKTGKKSTPGDKAKPPCTREDAIAFLAELQNASAEVTKNDGGLAVSRHISKRLSTAATFDAEAAPAAGGFGGGAIHSSGFSK